jgi:Flp pilus assembly protein TadG
MATAEFAVAIPVLVLVLVLALSAVTASMDQIRCIDAARATARSLARGDSDGAALALGRPLAPAGAEFALGGSPEVVQVSVRGAAPAALGWLGPVATPRSSAVAAREDTNDPAVVP